MLEFFLHIMFSEHWPTVGVMKQLFRNGRVFIVSVEGIYQYMFFLRHKFKIVCSYVFWLDRDVTVM